MKNALHGLALAAFCGLATPALPAADTALAAATSLHGNGLQLNALSINGLQANGLHLNGLGINGFRLNGLGLNGFRLHRAWIDGAPVVLQRSAADRSDADNPADQHLHRLAQTALLK